MVFAPVFCDKDGILLVNCMVKGAIITAESYVAFLGKLKHKLVSKLQGKLSKGILSLQDNAAPHKAAIMHQKLVDLHLQL
jgi:hypothetical protein